jgi:hypothetical protein
MKVVQGLINKYQAVIKIGVIGVKHVSAFRKV